MFPNMLRFLRDSINTDDFGVHDCKIRVFDCKIRVMIAKFEFLIAKFEL